MRCTNEETYLGKNGKCCERCPAGKFLKEECNETNTTTCSTCPSGTYTDELNYLKQCITCDTCCRNSLKVMNCTAKSNTVCECKEGFYCSEEKCEHCAHWYICPEGKGVKVKPTSKKNTVCAPCEHGTYSNVTDYFSPCKPHFSCESYGLKLKTPGNALKDAICEKCKEHCTWILPAGLWAGLVLTLAIVAAFIFLKAKRRSYRPVKSREHVTTVVIPEQVLPPPELLSNCTSCKYISDDPPIICGKSESLDSSAPITPLKASVSFVEPNQLKNGTGCPSSNFLRSYSEPQEDEWCGT